MDRALDDFEIEALLLDLEALEQPRRLSPEEHRVVAGPGWSHTPAHHDPEDADD